MLIDSRKMIAPRALGDQQAGPPCPSAGNAKWVGVLASGQLGIQDTEYSVQCTLPQCTLLDYNYSSVIQCQCASIHLVLHESESDAMD